MFKNYFSKLILLLFLIFVLTFQSTKAFLPNFSSNLEQEIRKSKNYSKKKYLSNPINSTKKSISASITTKSNNKVKKISFQKKLSILKLVLKNKQFKKKKPNHQKSTKWRGQHTAGLLSWASVLVAIMGFFTSHFLLGSLAACSAILFLILIFVEKSNKGTVDSVLWLFSQIINLIVIIATIFD